MKDETQKVIYDISNYRLRSLYNTIHGYTSLIEETVDYLLELLRLYRKYYPNPSEEIQQKIEENKEQNLIELKNDFSRVYDLASKLAELLSSITGFSRHQLPQIDVSNSSCPEELITSLQQIYQLWIDLEADLSRIQPSC